MTMKKLLFTVALLAFCLPAHAENPERNIVDWEKASRNFVPHTTKRVPAADILVRKANALLKGDPTCHAMVRASKLLDQADDLYTKVNAFDGDMRTVGRRVAWLEHLVEEGKCRK
jgi:hypothetical protein